MSTFDHAASFGRQAGAYARARPTYPAALFDWLAEISPARTYAVDVGTGAGQGALALADRFDRVLAVDVSADLLATIAPHPRLTTAVQSGEALDAGAPMGGLGELAPPEDAAAKRPVDLVTSFQSLHWYAGDTFWGRLRETLRPGGVFAAVAYAAFSVDAAVDRVIEARLLPAIAPHWSPRNQLVFDGYRGLDVPFSEIHAPEFHIAMRWTRAELLAYLGTWSAVARIREVEGRDVLAEIALEVAWPDDQPREVRMPLSVRAFRC